MTGPSRGWFGLTAIMALVAMLVFGLGYLLSPEPSAETITDDPDHDNLSTSLEFELGTNPHESDTDQDGIKDGDEIKMGLDPLDGRGAPLITP